MDKDKFETWWDECYKLPPGVSINDHFRQEYEVSFDDLVSNLYCETYAPSEPNILPVGDASGYVLTAHGSDCEWTVASIPQPANVCFYDSTGENSLTIDFDTGDVKISAKMTIDEAAKLFWDRVMALNPMGFPAKYLTTYDPQSMVEDYIFPHPRDGKGSKVEFLPELPKTPEQIALEAYTRAMKVVE